MYILHICIYRLLFINSIKNSLLVQLLIFIDLLLRQLIAMRLFNVFFASVRDYFAKNRVYNLFVEVPLTKTAIYFQRQRYISRPIF